MNSIHENKWFLKAYKNLLKQMQNSIDFISFSETWHAWQGVRDPKSNKANTENKIH